MAKDFFVLGIGGTGMRCIESLIHLCAMGMFDDTNIHLLAIDTDKNNGNFNRLKELKEAYLNTKGKVEKERTTHNETFFSANINYYEFSPNYENKSNFEAIFDYGNNQFKNKQETDIADLLFTKSVEEFNLRHGYRAQTHLGSLMMYHSIIEAANQQENNDLKRFIEKLVLSSQSGKAKVFILGSVFGGTGASSIPIIPQALAKAATITNRGVSSLLDNAYFASTLLSAYFSFKTPDKSEISAEKVIASSDRFALNSQVAMMFYNKDLTVQKTYQRFYMLGTPEIKWETKKPGTDNKTITGGANQKNDSHYIELLAACAALDFYRLDDNTLQTLKESQDVSKKYVFRSIEDNGKLQFSDFVGLNYEEEFAKKLGMLTVFSMYCNGTDDFVSSVKSGGQKEIQNYRDIDDTQINGIKRYFKLFNFEIQKDESLSEGWLRQIHRSAGSNDNFLLNSEIFTPKDSKTLKKCDWNDSLYKKEGVGKDYKFKTGWVSNKFNEFKSEFIIQDKKPMPSMDNRGEQLIKRIYDTLFSLYKIKN